MSELEFHMGESHARRSGDIQQYHLIRAMEVMTYVDRMRGAQCAMGAYARVLATHLMNNKDVFDPDGSLVEETRRVMEAVWQHGEQVEALRSRIGKRMTELGYMSSEIGEA